VGFFVCGMMGRFGYEGQVKRIISFAGEKIRFLKKLDGIR